MGTGAILGATSAETARALIELGGVVLLLGFLARAAARAGITAIPLFLLGGLAVGELGLLDGEVSRSFISFAAELGVLLLLLSLGLEYSAGELQSGLRRGGPIGALDAVLGFTPGFVAGLILGWEMDAAVLLGGVTWISSSGIIAKVLADLGRLGNRETPAVLNLLVIEDLAMAIYLPIVGALVAGRSASATAATVAVALAVVGLILAAAKGWGHRVSRHLGRGSDESLLLAVVGLALLVAGVAQELEVSAAIGAFLVGLGLTGPAQQRASVLVNPLRDLFGAWFFLFFALEIELSSLQDVVVPAVVLLVVTGLGKLVTGWAAAGTLGVAVPGRLRAGTVLIARGEFSIVIAALGADVAGGDDLVALTAAYVLLTAIAGPLLTKASHRIPVPAGLRPR